LGSIIIIGYQYDESNYDQNDVYGLIPNRVLCAGEGDSLFTSKDQRLYKYYFDGNNYYVADSVDISYKPRHMILYNKDKYFVLPEYRSKVNIYRFEDFKQLKSYEIGEFSYATAIYSTDDIGGYFVGCNDGTVKYFDKYGNFTGVEDQPEELNISVYPNPARDQVTVFNDSECRMDVKIYNLLGELVAVGSVDSGGKELFDVSRFPQGVYTLKARNSRQSAIKMIIIKR
jgi:hypothetical protein